MNNIIKIIRTLRKSTLIDLGKKLGLKNIDLEKDELVNAIEELFIKNDKKRNFTDSSFFKIGFPILMVLFGFFIGRVTDISNAEVNANLTKIDTTTQNKINKLYQPLPSNFQLKSLTIRVDKSVFADYLPEIRNLYTTSGLRTSYADEDFKDTIESGFQFYNGKYSDELRNLFDGKDLTISIAVGDDLLEQNSQLHKQYFIWSYSTKLWLRNNNQVLYYWVDHKNKSKEYLDIGYYNPENDKYVRHNKTQFINDFGSAMDLCDKMVRVSIIINENSGSGIRPPKISFNYIKLTDNNNRDYEVEFVKHSEFYSEKMLKSVRKHYPDYNPKNLQWYIEGVFKCKSF
ncbi:hypothetical protein [Maribacter aestuarii]|uniref:hypothetical protein n=1 Tax=Maribacter aestuarii TaxID=1130723 RepID=UPI00248D23B3|nr:hypothetical protein [Maribacter aestuarii]